MAKSTAIIAGLACGALAGTGTAAQGAGGFRADPHQWKTHRCVKHHPRHRQRCAHRYRARTPVPGPPAAVSGPLAPVASPVMPLLAPVPATSPGAPTPPSTTSLPSRLSVTENDTPSYYLVPSHNPVAAGTVTFNISNAGMDPHTFAIADPAGQPVSAVADTPARGGRAQLMVNLPPGRYTLLCTLADHAARGMQATLDVVP